MARSLALIRRVFWELPSMFGEARRGGFRAEDTHSNPQRSRGCHRFRGTSGKFPALPFEVHDSEGVMHLSASRKPTRLPKRFPVGTTYVVEGCGGEDGHLCVFSRYVILPGGERINLGADFTGPAAPRARRSWNRGESQAQSGGKRPAVRAKKIVTAGGTTRAARR
jgi:hypothetical protein